MTVTMPYLFQGWNCRMPGKYRDLLMDVATEEIGHVERIATTVARLLEGAPAAAVAEAAAMVLAASGRPWEPRHRRERRRPAPAAGAGSGRSGIQPGCAHCERRGAP